MRELEIRLLEGQNCAAVDLFDLGHARKVLAAFGRAFGRLAGGRQRAPTKEQDAFLDQAVAGLAQDGKVICVRLALFAEMMKGRPWTPATLSEVGGTEGVGVDVPRRDLQCRHRPARAPLSPEGGPGRPQGAAARIRHATSRATCGLTPSCWPPRAMPAGPADFDDLIRILDGEVRLITPTDPEGAEEIQARTASEGTQARSASAGGAASLAGASGL